MKYSDLDIDDTKAEKAFAAMDLPQDSLDERRAHYATLRPILLALRLPELIGLMFRILKDPDMWRCLARLSEIRVIFASNLNIDDPDVLLRRQQLGHGVPFLIRYVRANVPPEVWCESASRYKVLYAEQLADGIIPDFRTDIWREYWRQEYPLIKKNLQDRGLSVPEPDMGD